jgi:hypothetical protein
MQFNLHKIIICFAFFFVLNNELHGQSSPGYGTGYTQKKYSDLATNVVHASAFGRGSLLSLNYDWAFAKRKNFFMNFNMGAGVAKYNARLLSMGEFHNVNRFWTLENSLSVNFGAKQFFLEAGYGYAYFFNYYFSFNEFYPVVAFKIQPFDNRDIQNPYFFRIFSNVYNINKPWSNSWFGISIGKTIDKKK